MYAFYLIYLESDRKKIIIDTILITILGLGLSAPFWIPAILENKYVLGLGLFDPTKNFPVIYKLIYSSWGYGFSGTNAPDQMSLQIGIAGLFVLFCTLLSLFKNNRYRGQIVYFLVIFFG